MENVYTHVWVWFTSSCGVIKIVKYLTQCNTDVMKTLIATFLFTYTLLMTAVLNGEL